ncbi:MAG TPA: sigma-70 family RNA polymerase sigma factor [Asticcacaulis sp.]|nr:sigma-70 family RNA polymerase sigma factor [Asticcacaulis sp.]
MTPESAFAAWVGPHIGMLRRISRAFAAAADQNDLLQELLISAWKAYPNFRGESSAATFLYRVAHNRALTWKRKEGLRLFRFWQAAPDIAAVVADSGNPEDHRRLEALYAAIRQLAPVDRSLILLSLEGASYAEMAALHGLSESNIGARLSRARTRLTTLVSEASDGL